MSADPLRPLEQPRYTQKPPHMGGVGLGDGCPCAEKARVSRETALKRMDFLFCIVVIGCDVAAARCGIQGKTVHSVTGVTLYIMIFVGHVSVWRKLGYRYTVGIQ